jgi:hypothetical protein
VAFVDGGAASSWALVSGSLPAGLPALALLRLGAVRSTDSMTRSLAMCNTEFNGLDQQSGRFRETELVRADCLSGRGNRTGSFRDGPAETTLPSLKVVRAQSTGSVRLVRLYCPWRRERTDGGGAQHARRDLILRFRGPLPTPVVLRPQNAYDSPTLAPWAQ